jgi:hypothetical protein
MSDWTSVATAGIAGLSATVGAGVGYLAARRQAMVETRKLEAETERLRIQQAEEHLRHRQTIYHDFLDSAHRFHQAAGGIEPFEPPENYQRWARDFEHHLTAVSLFGTADARGAAQQLADAIEDAMSDAPEYDGDIEQRYLEAWRVTIDAMRLDTAPRDAEGS